jgi:acetate---CoA ligase (ADP-forming)
LKAAPLLNGFRGAAKADVAALSQLIAQISALAADASGEIAEIELNPVLVHPAGQGVTVVDALVVRKSQELQSRRN